MAVPKIFVAVTVKVKLPAAVGVPESTPAALTVSPGGKVPAVCATVGSGEPPRVKTKL